MFEKIKNFILHKGDFDFDRNDIILYDFHPQLRMIIAMNGIFFNNKESLLRFICPSILGGVIISEIILELISVHHAFSLKEYSFAIECLCHIDVQGLIPLAFLGLLLNRQKVYDIVDKMNQDFIVICKLEGEYKKKFLETQLVIWRAGFFFYSFISFVGLIYVMIPIFLLVHHSLFATQDEFTSRPLFLPLWLPNVDLSSSPIYEILVVFDIMVCVSVVQGYSAYMYILSHILLHYYAIMDMIILAFESLFVGLDEGVIRLPRDDPRRINVQLVLNQRIQTIVKWHLSVLEAVKTTSSVYGPVLVYQVMSTSIGLCVIGYQVAESLDQGKLDFRFTMLGVAGCLQMWVPCYLGTLIRDKAFAVGDSCWGCGWHTTPLYPMARVPIVFIIMCCQKPVTIKFPGLPKIDLETFSSIITTAYSYFNMLRQRAK